VNRRRFLGLTGGALGVAAAGLGGRWVLVPPRRSRTLASVDELAARLVDELDPASRAAACFAHDDPLRQYFNRGVGGGGLAVRPWGPSRRARGILTDLLHAGLSEAGRGRVPDQFFVNWPGVHAMRVAVCGDPRTGPWQAVLTAPHLNLRLGGRSPEGVAFGGVQVYGDQRGDGRRGLPGNVYRYQHVAGDRLFQSLSAAQRAIALQPVAPVQTDVGLQGPGGSFAGLPLAEASPASHALAAELVRGILSTYPDADVADAQECLAANGGLDALHVAYYAEGEVASSGEYQVFRLEGPAAVLYFRGHPHVHAFVHVARDAARPLGVGEELAVNPAPLAGPAVAALFEAALVAETGADLGYYPRDSVAGSLRAGTVRTGDVYCLESWQNRVAVVEVAGSALAPALARRLRERDDGVDPRRVYRIATTSWVADAESERLGRVAAREDGALVRDALIAHLRARGFGGRG